MSYQLPGIYLHIPFCRAKCPYCDFYSETTTDRIDAFIDAMLIEMRGQHSAISSADTIYLGGGTPSILSPGQIEKLLLGVIENWTIAPDTEITLEVNPGTVSREDLKALRQIGITRLNIGLQSIDDHSLKFLGRIHTAADGLAAYENARSAGFDNVGLDLIYGLVDQTPSAWQSQLEKVVALQPEHLSCYTLTVEPHTPLQREVQAGSVQLLDEQMVGDLFEGTVRFLNENGYPQYEISNFSRQEKDRGRDLRSRHNRKYWNGVDYLGFGPAAHSFVDGVRWWNGHDLNAYLSLIAQGKTPIVDREVLTQDQQIIEAVYLGLRQTQGIDVHGFADRFDTDFYSMFGACLAALDKEKLVKTTGDRVRLTVRGMRFLESVVDKIIS